MHNSSLGLTDFIKRLSVLVLIASAISCKMTSGVEVDAIELPDKQATLAAKTLYHRIGEVAQQGIAFGHQDATVYGIGWKHEDSSSVLKSDVHEVVGKYPAVFGFDVGHIERGSPINLDTVAFALIRDHIKRIHEMGGIITMSWHLDNPVSLGDSWDTTSAVSAVLKDGPERDKYEGWVERLADFLNSLKDENGQGIPVVFRPFHEMNGRWFWWGAGNCTPQEYKQLWRETFYLLHQHKVHNLLYAFSPNTMAGEEDFDLYYPGDRYVDILGVDIYNHGGNENFTQNLKDNLEMLAKKAHMKNMPYVLSESGNNHFGQDPRWWTQTLYPGIKDSGIAWALLWRNARASHYFSTYPGEISEEDFKEFEALEEILFLDEVKTISN